MSTDVADRVNDLRREMDRLRSSAARAEAQADQARAIHKESLAKLSQLGFSDPEAALEHVKQRREELQAEAEKIDELLRKAGRA